MTRYELTGEFFATRYRAQRVRAEIEASADAEAVALVRQAQAMGYRLALVPLEESR